MRDILLVTQFLPHYRKGVYEALAASGDLRVTFVAGSNIPGAGIPAMDESRLRRVLKVRNHWISSFLWQSGLLTMIQKERFDAIVFVGDMKYLSTWIAALYVRLKGGPRILFWTIGWHRPESGLKRWCRLAFYRLAHRLLLYGETGRALGERMGYPAHRMTVVYNSLPPSIAGTPSEALRRQLAPLREFQCVVGGVIRLLPSKSLDGVIEAAASLRDSGMDVAVLFVGEGPSRAELAKKAESLQVPIYMPGALYSHADLEFVYELLTATVVPGAIGLTAIQSLSYGVPVVTHGDLYRQGPEVEAVMDGVTGSLVEAIDPITLGQAISHWFRSDREAVARSCRQEVTAKWTAYASSRRIAEAVREEFSSRN